MPSSRAGDYPLFASVQIVFVISSRCTQFTLTPPPSESCACISEDIEHGTSYWPASCNVYWVPIERSQTSGCNTIWFPNTKFNLHLTNCFPPKILPWFLKCHLLIFLLNSSCLFWQLSCFTKCFVVLLWDFQNYVIRLNPSRHTFLVFPGSHHE